jgi:2-isopropylmalate synthase
MQLIEIEHWAAASRQGESSSGSVSVFYDGRTFRAYSGGDGPVDALLSAVDNAVEQIIGSKPQRIGYQSLSVHIGENSRDDAIARIAAPTTGDEAVARVYIGHGLSTNVLEASLRAYMIAVNKLIAEHLAASEARERAHGTESLH